MTRTGAKDRQQAQSLVRLARLKTALAESEYKKVAARRQALQRQKTAIEKAITAVEGSAATTGSEIRAIQKYRHGQRKRASHLQAELDALSREMKKLELAYKDALSAELQLAARL